ncbi:MAG TPA: zinc-ribbon domain-containing protein [Anaerolineae bacterium]|nr:zinc-ribbon domain-containing protein [Anaerolineae bacterium]
MTIGSILLGLALLILVVLYLGYPFLIPADMPPPINPSRRAELLARKESLLATIQNLDFDHETGKIAEDAYQQQRTQNLILAARTEKELAALGQRPPKIDKAIEREIAKLRGATAPPTIPTPSTPPPTPTPPTPPIPTPTVTPPPTPTPPTPSPATSGPFCTQCGRQATSDDKFCAQCGSPLAKVNA